MPAHPADIMPWSHAPAANVIALSDGGWLAVWHFQPQDRRMATGEHLEAMRFQFSQSLSSLPGDVVLWFDRERRAGECRLPLASWPHEQLAAMAAERDARNEGYLASHHHVCLALWPDTGRRERQILDLISEPESVDTSSLYTGWQKLTDEAERLFVACFADVDRLSGDDLASFLAGLCNDQRLKARMPALPVDLSLSWAASEIETGDRPKLGERTLRSVVVTDLPGGTTSHMLMALDELEITYRWSVRWRVLSQDSARREITRSRRSVMGRLKSLWTALFEKVLNIETQAAPDALSYLDECFEAEATLAEAGLGWGYATMVIICWSDEDAHNIRSLLLGKGVGASISTLTTIDHWLASIPGKRLAASYRQMLISTMTMADLAPVYGESRQKGTWLQCGSTFIGQGSGAGHGIIVGPTGSGKSVLAALLAASHLRHPQSRSIIIDRHRSAQAMIEACGGQWLEAIALQPMRDAGPHTRNWALDALLARGLAQSTRLDREVADMVTALGLMAPEERTLSAACMVMGSVELRDALATYAHGGLFDGLFEGTSDIAEHYLSGIEISTWPSHARPLAALALVQAIERMIEAKPGPTWLMIDEAALALRDTHLGASIETWLRTMRKFECRVWLATQSPRDMLEAGYGAIAGQLDHRVWLANAHAFEHGEQAAYRALGCDERMIELIAQAVPRRDYLWQAGEATRLIDLDLGPIQLATLAGQGAHPPRQENNTLSLQAAA